MKEIESGLIPEERLASYHRLTEKLIFQSKKAEIGLKRLEKEKCKQIEMDIKKYKKFMGKPQSEVYCVLTMKVSLDSSYFF